jgi:hypothetical protein
LSRHYCSPRRSPDAEAAFRQYIDKLMAGSEFSSLSVLPGDLCGYSGQKLMGSLTSVTASSASGTNTPNYLADVHLQGFATAGGFGAAESVLMADFGIVIP